MTDSKANHDHGGPSHPHGFEIKIDRATYRVQQSVMTGAELRKLPDPDIGSDRDLFEVVPGGSDIKVEIDAQVQIRNGLRFFTAPAQINPGKL